MAFIEEELDREISQGATFSFRDNVVVVETRDGTEQRNALWSAPKRTYTIAFSEREKHLIDDILVFYARVGGQRDGFLFFDWNDNSFENEDLVPITPDPTDDTATEWQIVKRYGSAIRNIRKPIDGTITGLPAGASVDYETGIVTLPAARPSDASIPISGQFRVPVRFADDTLDTVINYIGNSQVIDVQLVELFTL